MPTADTILTWTTYDPADVGYLADAGLTAQVTVAYDSTVGNPAGSLRFSSNAFNLAAVAEKARRVAVGQSWQNWGVPAGAVVSAVQVISWDHHIGPHGISSASARARGRFVDASGTIVHTAGDLFDQTFNTIDTFTPEGAGTQRPVDGTYQAAASDVRFEIEVAITTGSSGAGSAFSCYLDNILVRITYTGGTGSPTDPGTPPSDTPAPDGGIYLADGTYIPGYLVCGCGQADKLQLIQWMRDGHQ